MQSQAPAAYPVLLGSAFSVIRDMGLRYARTHPIKKPLDLAVQGLLVTACDQAASIFARFCSTLER
ncbi:hypothetical protein FEM54_15935 [Pseudomonas edaphica]|uniref:Uncharacterized protein n=1 Tax=Pseudomonas edaphica TaxID=2006980 RepID=A0ABY2U7F0_9PSED|nr:hypothetical protein FEM54_15935 [Pseudomonas edaphica]